MRLSLRLRIVPLAAALVVHAVVVGAMLSALQAGTISVRAVRDGQLERASPVPMVQAIISGCPNCRSVDSSGEPLALPAPFRADRFQLRVPLPLFDVQWGTRPQSSPPLSAASRPGIGSARCEVHIHQDRQGRVQAIDLGQCTENAAWQTALLQSLILAAARVTPSSGVRAPELTLTLNTNRISAVLLARLLSDPVSSMSNGRTKYFVPLRQH